MHTFELFNCIALFIYVFSNTFDSSDQWVCCFWDSICASRNIGVTALFPGTLVVFPLKQETFLILWAMQGLKSNLYSISLLLSTTAATNQLIVSASQNGCWSSNKQQCKINEGKRIVISISITDSVRSLTWGEREGKRERERTQVCYHEHSTPAVI